MYPYFVRLPSLLALPSEIAGIQPIVAYEMFVFWRDNSAIKSPALKSLMFDFQYSLYFVL